MNITFLGEASREFSSAYAYYETQQNGLGQRFEEEIDRAIRWLAENPEALPLRRGVYRRLNLHIFPYYIPYVVRGSTLWVLAIAHGRMRPEYWVKRVKKIE